MARSFNGSSDLVNPGNAAALDPQFPMTVVARIKASSLSGTSGILTRGQGGLNGWGFQTSGTQLQFTKYGVAVIAATTINLSTATDFLVAAVVTSTQVRFAKVGADGSLTAQNVADSNGFSGSPSVSRIGCEVDAVGSNTTFFSGNIAEVAKYDADLSDDDLVALGKGFSTAAVRPAALAFHAPLIRELVEIVSGAALAATGTTVADHPRLVGGRRRALIGRTAAGGGTTYSESISLAASAALVAAAAVRMAGAVTIAGSADAAMTALATFTDGITAAATAAASLDGTARFTDAAALAASGALSVSAGAQAFSESIALAATPAFDAAGALHLSGSIALGASADLAAAGSLRVGESVAFSATLDASAAASLTMREAIAAAATAAVAFAASSPADSVIVRTVGLSGERSLVFRLEGRRNRTITLRGSLSN